MRLRDAQDLQIMASFESQRQQIPVPLPDPDVRFCKHPGAISDGLVAPELTDRERRSAWEVGARIGAGHDARTDEVSDTNRLTAH